MYCRKCGANNDENAWKCTSCGEVLQEGSGPVQANVKIANYLAQSILVTVLCCLPLGIPAIVFSAQVNGKIQAGDIQGAMESSRKAKMWGWWSFGVGLVGGLLYLMLVVIGVAAGG